MSDDTVAVIGSGGIGGYVAGTLAEAGRAVTLCVRTPFDRLTIEEGGATREVALAITAEPAAVSPTDWVLVTTKAQDTAGAAPWFDRLVGPNTTVVVVQNGIGHADRAKPFAGAAQVMPAIIYCSVERTRPGRIVHHTSARLLVPKGQRSPAFAELFAGTPFEVVEDEDFTTVAWRKLLSNVAANPITALTLRRVRVFENAAVRSLAAGLMAETLQVARADGARLTQADADGVLNQFGKLNPDGGTSMLYDRLAERPLEHAYITGAIVEAGERHGIETPLNRAILALLEGASGHSLDGST